MGQLLVRQLDDSTIDRLKARARARKTSVEALAREALTEAAGLTTEEKVQLVREMQARIRATMVPGVPHTLGVDLIRESRDLDH